MARGTNKVILLGYCGKDVIKSNGVLRATLATTEKWRDKQTKEMNERTEWHKLVFFNKSAETAAEYLKPGALVFIEGRLQTNKWTDKNQNTRYTTEIVVSEYNVLNKESSQPEASPEPEEAVPDFDDDISF